MVRNVFRPAKENAPAIIFIDEIDAIATARFEAQTGADREVQHILMELLNQAPPPTFTLHMSMYRSSWQDAKYPPLSSVRHLTVQPGGESHCSAARFLFFFHLLSFAVIQVQKSITSTQCRKVCQWLVLILSGKRSEFQTWHPTTEH
jgi:hypothetical protein